MKLERFPREEGTNILIGGAVMAALLIGITFVYLSSAKRKQADGYPLIARFHKAEGVAVGTDVRLAGMVVGEISAQSLDDQFRAVLTLHLRPSVQLPKDSNASIQTDSLLGAKFVALQPGGDDQNLKPGAEIAFTQDSLAVQDLLDMIISQAEAARGKP